MKLNQGRAKEGCLPYGRSAGKGQTFFICKTDEQLYLVKLGKEKIDYASSIYGKLLLAKQSRKNVRVQQEINAKQYVDNLISPWDLQNELIKIHFAYRTLTYTCRYGKIFWKNRDERVIKVKQTKRS